MKNMKRALRRHHSKRMEARARKLLLATWGDIVKFDKIFLAEKAKLCYNNYTICSCPMCGNPRHMNGTYEYQKTIQELQNEDKYKEQINEN